MRKTLILLFMLLCSVCDASPFEWVPAGEGQWACLDLSRPAGSRQVGCYDEDTDLYTPLVNGEWGVAQLPPSHLPESCRRKRRRHELPTGVQWEKVPNGEHVRLNGKEISKDDALVMLGKQPKAYSGDKKVPDDRKTPRITVIGSVEKCAAPLAVAKKFPQFISEDYRPEFWAIQRQGFKVDADPTIYIQDSDGGVFRRLDGYKTDADFEAVINDVIGRKVGPQPNYDPKKDEGWKRFLPSLPGLNGDVPWVAIGVIVVLIGVAIWRRKEKV